MSKTPAASSCPEDGVCTFEILDNSSLSIKRDEFGALYPEITKGDKFVVIFEYERHKIPNTADSGYNELIYLELDSDTKELNLENKDLSKVKLLFARLCFCRGQTGYYNINQGKLSLSKNNNNTYSLRLEFKTDEVPQVIHTIEEELK